MTDMGNIDQILELERSNKTKIHLYKTDRKWLAFERSAFNLYSSFYVDSIFKVMDLDRNESILIAVLKSGVGSLLVNPPFTVVKKSDEEVLMNCRVTYGGFEHWKDNLVPLYYLHDLSVDMIGAGSQSNVGLRLN